MDRKKLPKKPALQQSSTPSNVGTISEELKKISEFTKEIHKWESWIEDQQGKLAAPIRVTLEQRIQEVSEMINLLTQTNVSLGKGIKNEVDIKKADIYIPAKMHNFYAGRLLTLSTLGSITNKEMVSPTAKLSLDYFVNAIKSMKDAEYGRGDITPKDNLLAEIKFFNEYVPTLFNLVKYELNLQDPYFYPLVALSQELINHPQFTKLELPQQLKIFYNVANLYEKTGNLAEAVTTLTQAGTLLPKKGNNVLPITAEQIATLFIDIANHYRKKNESDLSKKQKLLEESLNVFGCAENWAKKTHNNTLASTIEKGKQLSTTNLNTVVQLITIKKQSAKETSSKLIREEEQKAEEKAKEIHKKRQAKKVQRSQKKEEEHSIKTDNGTPSKSTTPSPVPVHKSLQLSLYEEGVELFTSDPIRARDIFEESAKIAQKTNDSDIYVIALAARGDSFATEAFDLCKRVRPIAKKIHNTVENKIQPWRSNEYIKSRLSLYENYTATITTLLEEATHCYQEALSVVHTLVNTSPKGITPPVREQVLELSGFIEDSLAMTNGYVRSIKTSVEESSKWQNNKKASLTVLGKYGPKEEEEQKANRQKTQSQETRIFQGIEKTIIQITENSQQIERLRQENNRIAEQLKSFVNEENNRRQTTRHRRTHSSPAAPDWTPSKWTYHGKTQGWSTPHPLTKEEFKQKVNQVVRKDAQGIDRQL